MSLPSSPSPTKAMQADNILNKENQVFKPSKFDKSGPELSAPMQINCKDSDSDNFSDSGMSGISGQNNKEDDVEKKSPEKLSYEYDENKPRKSKKISFVSPIVKVEQSTQVEILMAEKETFMTWEDKAIGMIEISVQTELEEKEE